MITVFHTRNDSSGLVSCLHKGDSRYIMAIRSVSYEDTDFDFDDDGIQDMLYEFAIRRVTNNPVYYARDILDNIVHYSIAFIRESKNRIVFACIDANTNMPLVSLLENLAAKLSRNEIQIIKFDVVDAVYFFAYMPNRLDNPLHFVNTIATYFHQEYGVDFQFCC